MLAHHFTREDVADLDRILDGNKGHDVRLDLDRIVCIGKPAFGCLIWRPGGVVHELHAGTGLNRRCIASDLVNFAIADAISRPFNLHEAVFVADSDDMARYVESLGAVEQVGRRVFTLQLRG